LFLAEGEVMAEGLFRIRQLTSLVFPAFKLRSVLRVDTGRMLEYQVFRQENEAREWTGFISRMNGSETFRWGLTEKMLHELDLSNNSEDWSGFVSHELVEHLREGGQVPFKTKWKGTGTGVVVSPEGYILTNQHLVSGPQKAFQLPEGVFDPVGYRCPSLKIQTSDGEDLGTVFICYCSTELDVAILRLETSTSLFPAQISNKKPIRHQRCWMFGYPCRTVRPQQQLEMFGYHNAEYELRGSVGLLIAKQNETEWLSDCDAGPGSSGSPVFGDDGTLIGLYRGAQPNGIITEKSGISGMTHPSARLKRIINIPLLSGNRLPSEVF
jgi:hypothetical protein